MGKDLIIVESPAKVKTIKKFLGSHYMVQASVGHIRDLPTRTLGVDESANFAPQYEIIKGKEKVVNDLQSAASMADTVYLAPDPDREGEAIAWHIAELIKSKAKNIKRIQFNEITKRAVEEAIKKPHEINTDLFDAQQARRVLDRLVGYKISPLLWKTVKRGISAGRVQSVALRLIVEREEERLAFVPQEYWNFKAQLQAVQPPVFFADLAKLDADFSKQIQKLLKSDTKGKASDSKKYLIRNKEQADALEQAMQGLPFVVLSVEEKERARNPLPPFTTSTLQQAANQRLGFTSKRTMSIAQKLYEGVELGERGTAALITYMRTDSVRIATEAKKAAENFILETYGEKYAVKNGRSFRGKTNAQDAHEAIRPVDSSITPDQVKSFVTPEQYRLYNLIWCRFIASQMAAALFHDTVAMLECGPSTWKAQGERMLFDGFLKVMTPGMDEGGEELPPLEKGQKIRLEKLIKEQKFTQPAPRFTEASLVRELEERGIGRPSTYATIISTLQDREYVRLDEKHFVPTDLGTVVCSQLRDNFAKLMDVGFTASMESSLDEVADGKQNWTELMHGFANDFNPTLAQAAKTMKRVNVGMEAGLPCPECGKPLMIKFGKSGEFLACSAYPDCKFTSDFTRDEKGEVHMQERVKESLPVVGKCPQCQGDVVLRKSRTGSRFLSCSRYPECSYTASYSTKVPCPQCSQGELVEKSSKRGKIFYACNRYPDCKYALWDYPIARHCPECESPILVLKNTKSRGRHIACPNCKHTEEEQ